MENIRGLWIVLVTGVLALVLSTGCGRSKSALADDAGGKKPEDFPELAVDVFKPMDGGIALSPDEIKGRNRHQRENLLKINEDGAFFRSYLDGRKLCLNPEISMDIQRKLGADLIVQMDECTAYQVTKDYTAKSMEMSMRWGDRSLHAYSPRC